ncbi:hypothetical protein BD413DRAFT_133657 [Trametes elegans]|nr:hypothetical protein BD413DRAFT_133657 [Trametes elegans]
MITGTMRALRKEREARCGPLDQWQTTVSTLLQNTLIEPFDAEISSRAATGSSKEVGSSSLAGAPTAVLSGRWAFAALARCPTVTTDASTPRSPSKANAWFVNLIGDQDVLKSTYADIGVIGTLVAQTGAAMRARPRTAKFYQTQALEESLVDIGILRLPDINHPPRVPSGAWRSRTRARIPSPGWLTYCRSAWSTAFGSLLGPPPIASPSYIQRTPLARTQRRTGRSEALRSRAVYRSYSLSALACAAFRRFPPHALRSSHTLR